MSIICLTHVMRHSEAKLGARLVLFVLAEFAHDDGTKAFPTVETIMERTRMSRRGVQDALRKLEGDGLIVQTGQTGYGARIYTVILTAAESAPAQNGASGAQFGTGNTSDSAPNPSENPPKDPSKSAREEPIGFSEWLGTHVQLAELYGVEQSVPRAGTSARASLAVVFAGLMAEGYAAEEFALASEGVLASDFMRDGGHVKPENVLRKTKLAGRVDEGRRARAKRLAKEQEGPGQGDQKWGDE